MQGCCVDLSVVISGTDNWVILSTGYAFYVVPYQAEMRLAGESPLACCSGCMVGFLLHLHFFWVRRDDKGCREVPLVGSSPDVSTSRLIKM